MRRTRPSASPDNRDESRHVHASDEPEEQHDRTIQADQEAADEREATELTAYHEHPPVSANASAVQRSDRRITRFWRRNVSLTLPHDTCRDHLANERTFLAYLRTSLALSMVGITTTQLFRIQLKVSMYPTKIGYFSLGIPLGAAFQVAAMILVAISCHRYLRQQMSMARVRTNGYAFHKSARSLMEESSTLTRPWGP
ncbi:hypothetical protein K461DRAFT_266022 [Myriangium duriaei CBS 260.36]|uniref:DUF202 domain-containing protein n=1 Tax=Myriangium duriaei CBS 260.36 TaxID=1168546 RepID=A0A9P4J7J6_9PEZI|nr:hypothetical protein K461DRAFT_266022 [Myriangium duriaei CBS 260.36]